jgi:uncharacterized protein
MLNLSLIEVARGEVEVRGEIPPDDPIWEDAGIVLREPLRARLEAREVGEGVLVRGRIRARLDVECRRCLKAVEHEIDDEVDLLFEPLDEEEAVELGGEVYALPRRSPEVDLREPLREQLLLRVPEYVVCREECRGLCPRCGIDRNEASCECDLAGEGSPWDALRNLTFD